MIENINFKLLRKNYSYSKFIRAGESDLNTLLK